MTPLYLPGDYILCMKAKRLHVGDIVIAESKPYGKLIKRIQFLDGERKIARLEGIHSQSITTEEMGDVPYHRILWKVLFPKGRKAR